MLELIRETLERSSYGAPALPFPELVGRLRAEGCAITEGILLRRLAAPDSGVRLVDPWHASMRPLRRYLDADGQGGDGRGGDGPWVVLVATSGLGEPEEPTVRTLRRSLRRLTVELDEGSPSAVARWVALVEEAKRLPRAA